MGVIPMARGLVLVMFGQNQLRWFVFDWSWYLHRQMIGRRWWQVFNKVSIVLFAQFSVFLGANNRCGVRGNRHVFQTAWTGSKYHGRRKN
jgi:hypothetical protein